MSEETTTYLGDSVYAEIDGGMIKLTTDNGFGPSNTIYLEVSVYQALTRFVPPEWRQSCHGCGQPLDQHAGLSVVYCGRCGDS